MGKVNRAAFGILCSLWLSYRISQEEVRPQFRRYMIIHMPDVRESCLDDMWFDDEKKNLCVEDS